ncbi:protein kinase domain-containing protein [Kitasatospora mediocidica]|uniref:protein kinase domain-containing protein n=1 Tax=Kitasatospora mediocidica TaxID=58352 RepID=UPI0005696B11|nr:protein kinase [Kitasatospora mediocidica]
MAGRYQVTDGPEPSAAHGDDRYALDGRTGRRVLLEGLDLPEVVVADFYRADQAITGRWLDPEGIVAEVAAAIASCPEHPRLRQAYEVVAQDGTVWISGELPAAVPLAQLLSDGRLAPFRVAELAADLAGALRAVHTAGRVHGNLGIDQVLVCEDGAALLGGHALGVAQEALARALGGSDGRRWTDARTGQAGVRAERWPPELLGAPGVAEQPADCWALGVLLFRLLTGYGPFPEQSPTALFAAVRAGRPASTEGCGPLRPLVDQLLAADPAKRPDAKAIRVWLTELLATAPEPYRPDEEASSLPVLRPARPLSVRRRTTAEVVAPEHTAKHARSGPAAPSPVLLVGGVLTAMLLALAAVVLLGG